MVNKKVYIVLILILIVFFVLMFYFFGIDNIKQDSYESAIIVGEDTLWLYKNRKWLNINSNSDIEEYNWKKYYVFVDNEELGYYDMWKDDKWYAFDNNKNAIRINGKLFAYQANFKMKLLNYIEEKNTNNVYIETVLKENNLDVDSRFTSNYHITFDFDNDGFDEDFYIISNAFPLDFNPDKSFSIAFMVKDNIIYNIYNNIKNGNSLDICKPYYHTIVDTNNDGVYEILLSCGMYSNSGTLNMLYQFIDNEFKIVVSNQ